MNMYMNDGINRIVVFDRNYRLSCRHRHYAERRISAIRQNATVFISARKRTLEKDNN